MSFGAYPRGVSVRSDGQGLGGDEDGQRSPTHKHGYSASSEQPLNRLRRIEGQVRGVERMVEEDRHCIDIVTQISAVQAALDKVALGLLYDHAGHCIIGGADRTPEELKDELTSAVGPSCAAGSCSRASRGKGRALGELPFCGGDQ